MAEAKILVAQKEGIVQIRVVGRATFKISRSLREYAIGAVRKGITSLTVDLSECQGMDSTFIGVLAMIGLEANTDTELVIVNARESHRKLLSSIGVARLWHFTEEPVADVNWKSLCEAAGGVADMQKLGPTVIAAHKTLMDLEPENVPKFKDVVDMLSAETEENETEENEGTTP